MTGAPSEGSDPGREARPEGSEGEAPGSAGSGRARIVELVANRWRPNPTWSDEALVQACLAGREDAWFALIDKYRNLIFSVPLRYGLSEDHANEIFQQVCLAMLSNLSQLREPRALAAWLIRTAAHESFNWRRQAEKHAGVALDDAEAVLPSGVADLPDHAIRELQREQLLREAILALPPRCRELIQMLFFERPAVRYADVAKRLGLAKGSIGFTRTRCLQRLRRHLEKNGFQ
jgi:RNA polymerase sigma factor (sigma-70 family)